MSIRPKFLQVKKSFLLSPISSAETGSFVLNALVDCYGNQIQSASFATVLRFTFNPGGDDEEIITATGFTINSDGTVTVNAGITRALLAVYPYTAGGIASSHTAGTPVIIQPDNPQLFEEILTYVDGLVLAAAVQATKTAVGYVKLTENNTSSRVMPALVSQQVSPNMTVLVTKFDITTFDQVVSYAGGNSGVMTAPTVNPRIDLIVYDTGGAVIAVRTGTEAASPSAPTPTTGDVVLAKIYHRVGSTSIKEQDDSTNSYVLAWMQPSLYKTGVITSSSFPVVTEIDQSQTTQNSSVAVGEANVTTKKSIIAQSFVPTVVTSRGVKLYKAADTGTFTGTVKIALQVSTAGAPSGVDLASFTITNAVWAKIPTGEFTIQFSTQYTTLTLGATYWIVVTPSTSDTSNHPNLGINTAGGYASGVLRYNNSADGWVTVTTSILYFKALEGSLSVIPKTDSVSGLPPAFVRPYSLVEFNKTGVTSSDTTEVTVYSKLLEGGFFTATSGIKLAIAYAARLVSSGLTIKIKGNGTVLATIAVSQENNGSVTAGSGIADAIIVNTSLSAQIHGWRSMHMTNVSNTATGLGTAADQSTGTSALDTSQPVLIEVTFQISSTSTTSWSYNWLTLEKIG